MTKRGSPQQAQLLPWVPQQAHSQALTALLQQVQLSPDLQVQEADIFPQQAQPQSLLDLPQQPQLEVAFMSVMGNTPEGW